MLDQFFSVYLVDAISYFARGDYCVKLCIMRWFSCLKSKFVWIFQKCQSRIWWALTKLPNQWWNSNGVETKFVSAFVLGLFEGVTSFKLCIFISLLSPPPPSKKKKKFFKFYCVVYWKINILLLKWLCWSAFYIYVYHTFSPIGNCLTWMQLRLALFFFFLICFPPIPWDSEYKFFFFFG